MFEDKNACIVICPKNIKNIQLCKYVFGDTKDIYFVGDNVRKRFFCKFFSPEKLINCALKRRPSRSLADILDLLEMTDTARIDRQWRYLGNDKWIYSVALGLALGKKNFCMPWMPMMDYQEYRNHLIIRAMKKINGKVLFPLGEVDRFLFIDEQDILIKHFDDIIGYSTSSSSNM